MEKNHILEARNKSRYKVREIHAKGWSIGRMENIAEKVRQIIAEQLDKPIDEVKLESRFVEDLEADSLDTVEMIIALEEAFNRQIPDIDAERMKSVGDVVKYLEKHLRDRSDNLPADGKS